MIFEADSSTVRPRSVKRHATSVYRSRSVGWPRNEYCGSSDANL